MPAIISIVKSICFSLTTAAAVLSATQFNFSLNDSNNNSNTDQTKIYPISLKISQVQFSPDSKNLAVLAGDQLLSSWPVDGGNPTSISKLGSIPLTCLDWNPRDNNLLIGTSKSQIISYDHELNGINSNIDCKPEIVNQICITGVGETVITLGTNLNPNGKLTHSAPQISHKNKFKNLENIPDLQYMSICFDSKSGVLALGAATGEIILVNPFSEVPGKLLVKLESPIEFLKWSTDNLVASSEGTLHFIDCAKKLCVRSVQISNKPVKNFEISNDNKMLFIAAGSDTVQVRNTTSGELISRLASTKEMVSAISLSPDEKTLAVGTCQGNVTLWNTSDFQIKSIIPAGIR